METNIWYLRGGPSSNIHEKSTFNKSPKQPKSKKTKIKQTHSKDFKSKRFQKQKINQLIKETLISLCE